MNMKYNFVGSVKCSDGTEKCFDDINEYNNFIMLNYDKVVEAETKAVFGEKISKEPSNPESNEENVCDDFGSAVFDLMNHYIVLDSNSFLNKVDGFRSEIFARKISDKDRAELIELMKKADSVFDDSIDSWDNDLKNQDSLIEQLKTELDEEVIKLDSIKTASGNLKVLKRIIHEMSDDLCGVVESDENPKTPNQPGPTVEDNVLNLDEIYDLIQKEFKNNSQNVNSTKFLKLFKDLFNGEKNV